ncbi:MAG: hypothetical protein LBJ11_03530 [Oscillospiraceae bacterium]|jgi:hypothetical protein|nr:hypothetical protein [Oscillospiraceae bacterium]
MTAVQGFAFFEDKNCIVSDGCDCAIPHPVIQTVIRPGTNEQWLRANIYGKPQPGDRLYLRRLSRSGPTSDKRRIRVKRMAHPTNPSGAAGGDLPEHLVNRAYFHGSVWQRNGTEIRTEWELHHHNETILLMPLDVFAEMYYFNTDLGKFVTEGSHAHISFALDFVVARPNAERTHVTYGPSSSFLRIRPVKYTLKEGILRWGVEFR